MATAMFDVFVHMFPNITAVTLTESEEWSSRGEFRKFFARVAVGDRVVLVSGQYHLDRLRLIVEKYHPDHAPHVEYHAVEADRATCLMRLIEIPKLWLIKQPEERQQKIRHWAQRLLKFLPV